MKDRVAVVTGASSGLGAHFARVLHERGMKVVLAARRQERLQTLADELGRENAEPVAVDVTEEDGMRRLVDRAVERFGRLDVMLNNAGVVDGAPAENEPVEDFEHVLNVNLSAVFTGCREAARVMLPTGRGSIVNIASVAGFVSLAERYSLAGYVASKSGVVGLTRELAAQWASRGVRVNAIAPGWFPSQMTGHLRDREQVDWIEERTPLGRVGRLEDLDGALVFLASDASSFVIGQTIAVDGGWTIR